MSDSPKHHTDRLDAALALLDEARGFAAMSPQGRENIIEVSDMLPDLIEQAYRSGFMDGEKHSETERKENSSFVPVPEKGTIVPPVSVPVELLIDIWCELYYGVGGEFGIDDSIAQWNLDAVVDLLARANALPIPHLKHAGHDRANWRNVVSRLCDAYAACNGEDHPAYNEARKLLSENASPHETKQHPVMTKEELFDHVRRMGK